MLIHSTHLFSFSKHSGKEASSQSVFALHSTHSPLEGLQMELLAKRSQSVLTEQPVQLLPTPQFGSDVDTQSESALHCTQTLFSPSQTGLEGCVLAQSPF